MSKPVYVLLREVKGDPFHHGFAEFQGVYKTLKLAKSAAQEDFGWECKLPLSWTHKDGYGDYGGESRWDAQIKDGVLAVIEDYDVVTAL